PPRHDLVLHASGAHPVVPARIPQRATIYTGPQILVHERGGDDAPERRASRVPALSVDGGIVQIAVHDIVPTPRIARPEEVVIPRPAAAAGKPRNRVRTPWEAAERLAADVLVEV